MYLLGIFIGSVSIGYLVLEAAQRKLSPYSTEHFLHLVSCGRTNLTKSRDVNSIRMEVGRCGTLVKLPRSQHLPAKTRKGHNIDWGLDLETPRASFIVLFLILNRTW